ncbi:Serine/threonine-protein kinase PCRK1 [Cocos nucifera]|uniref:non-specific serine/threonine protein kinase n=1 Tax=Cocos nucifera TaxID=13894 RepID=A0A8K0IJK6_COCNU|nr:Serine/threonine-protein kinase PCRK1 [Cocos nucifera]
MACFGLFKSKKKTRNSSGPNPATASAPPSNVSTSRSDDSAAGKHPSKSSASTSSPRSILAMYEEKAHNLRVFELDELRSATNDFNRMLKLGEGGFGSVYKGFIKPLDGKGDRIAVAVKKLNQHGVQGHKQWLAEVQFLGVVEHPNLVKLIGYCAVDGERGIQRLLVYEFMPNKSLEDHLFNRNYPGLSWNLRLQIALGAAEGLAYLHEGLEVQVIYRDFKASNVLLDKEFRPKLSDFGLPVGTYGYAAPDYIQTGHLTIESDVWSFGVVLYEILTGRRTYERNRPQNEQKLLEWVKQYPADGRKFSMIMDPRLRNQYSLGAAREVAKLANGCLVNNRKDRPKMREVVECLKQAIQMDSMEEHPSTSSLDKQKKPGSSSKR